MNRLLPQALLAFVIPFSIPLCVLHGQQPAAMQNGGQPTQQPGAAQNGQRTVPLMTAQQAVQAGVAQVRQQPFPALNAADQQFVDQVLDVWEKRTAQVDKYVCQFKRWQYDPTQFAESFYSQSSGELRYMAPDKASFVISKLETIFDKKSNPHKYKEDPRNPHGEYWICDGEWVFIRDRNLKKEVRIQLPPSMRGQNIPNSPLPFLFGVKAAELKQRYWIRDVTKIAAPPGGNTVWLEAWPKRPDDAGNYSRVQIVLDRKDILPAALIVFLPQWTPQQQFKEIFEFTDRQIPAANLWNAVKQKVFNQAFIPTKLDSSWTIEEEPFIPPQQQPVGGQRVAQPPVQNQINR
ncbi:MAG: TIGR03009 domain-containing protein [Planctomycetota bacterium]